jgi:hypothetical protein
VLGACGTEVPSGEFAVSDRAAVHVSPREPCIDYNPLKNPYFGDLHVHTALSNDGFSFGVRARPDDAYRYAFGAGSVTLPIDRADTQNTRSLSIDRPLDFMAVTDHAEFLGEQTLCADPASQLAEVEFCRSFEEGAGRNPGLLAKIFSPFPQRDEALCGVDGARCAEAAEVPWGETIEAAEKWNDISADCERTAFIGFEYSSHRLGSNLHRNVIFRNAVVTRRPVSFIDAPREWRLWEILDKECLGSGTGCDALAIPHNTNISNGRMFAVDYAGAFSTEEQAARAELRMKLEPVIEIMQHKGDSECRNGLSGVLGGEDELCDFEKFENLAFTAITGQPRVDECYDGPFADYVPHKGPNCLSRNSYVRYALIEGLKEEARIGINPFKFGITASTDTHNATGGAVAEKTFAGHLGWGIPGNASNSPGGLIGVWSEQNTRTSLFDSIRRKEVFGTSGPRIKPRFFGGWSYDPELCNDPALVARAYATGVSMGGDLPARSGEKPVFVAFAQSDPGTPELPGVPLQRLQIIKGWYDEEGRHHQRVIDIAGNPDNGASVDPATCQPRGEGHAQICAVWADDAFDPEQRAVYYMRAVENPSCRYNGWQCLTMAADRRPADCDNPSVPKVLQERAWTSPIWYTPRG